MAKFKYSHRETFLIRSANMVFVKAQTGPANVGDPKGRFTVQYFDEKGNMTIRSNGTRAWRCNNPGNLLASPYSRGKSRRSIGVASDGSDEYAVYPDYETGHEALIVMLKGSVYSPMSLRAAMKKYDSKNLSYIDEIVKITKLDPERTIKSLSTAEFLIFWKAIEQIENWEVGDEEFIERWIIAGVHKKHNVITEYLIKRNAEMMWLTKPDAIKLAIEGRLHAIIVHLKTGITYLRPEFKTAPFALV
jgi:hypothetical protein